MSIEQPTDLGHIGFARRQDVPEAMFVKVSGQCRLVFRVEFQQGLASDRPFFIGQFDGFGHVFCPE